MKFDAELANNPEPRLACVLLLDTSGSMGGAPISELNAGLRVFKEEINEDSLARKRVEVAIVTFGGPVSVAQDFQTVDAFQPPKLGANGDTPMGAAIHKALDMVRERKEGYKAHGLSYYRPWLFLITDGAPTDAWEDAAERLTQEINGKNVAFFAVGVKGADMDVLARLSPKRAPLQLEGLKFRELFEWLSNSMSTVSHSGTPTADGDVQAPLPSVSDWAKV